MKQHILLDQKDITSKKNPLTLTIVECKKAPPTFNAEDYGLF